MSTKLSRYVVVLVLVAGCGLTHYADRKMFTAGVGLPYEVVIETRMKCIQESKTDCNIEYVPSKLNVPVKAPISKPVDKKAERKRNIESFRAYDS